ncbi:MAG TPA: hypothetical protein VK789_13855 [Bryobacteraceae bacterium]|nr:hypothetical protein [Bryobacteraceae bacterium]
MLSADHFEYLLKLGKSLLFGRHQGVAALDGGDFRYPAVWLVTVEITL